jgi:hypothetical protein
MSSINEFKANLLGAGPRANRFRVYIPRTVGAIEFLCKTASLPGQTIAETPVNFRGMIIKLAGAGAQRWSLERITAVLGQAGKSRKL